MPAPCAIAACVLCQAVHPLNIHTALLRVPGITLKSVFHHVGVLWQEAASALAEFD